MKPNRRCFTVASSRVVSSVALLSLLPFGAPLGAQEADARPFCQNSDRCIPDQLEVVITSTPEPTSRWELSSFQPGQRVDVEAQLVVQTSGIQGFSYAVAHDAAFLTLLEDTVTTDGTILDPNHPQSVWNNGFRVILAVDGGWISAIVLSFTLPNELPLGRQTLALASYTLDANPGLRGTRVELAHQKIGPDGAPPTEITLTMNGEAKRPELLVDAVILDASQGERDCADGIDNDDDGFVDCNDPECQGFPDRCLPCDDWAFYFGDDPDATRVEVGEGTRLPIHVRNVEPALAFQLGIAVEPAGEAYRLSFTSLLGVEPSRPLPLTITDEAAVSRDPAARQSALADSLPVAVARGAALEGLGPNDFLAVELEPAGGPGLTAGYVVDVEAPDRAIPATAGDRNTCPTQELLVIELEGPPARFVRGDADGSGKLDVSDIFWLLRVVLGLRPPRFDCEAALDTNSDGKSDVSDALPPLRYLFVSGPPLEAPFPDCGTDPNPDGASCDEPSPFCP